VRTLDVRTLDVRTLDVRTLDVRTLDVRTYDVSPGDVPTSPVPTSPVPTSTTSNVPTLTTSTVLTSITSLVLTFSTGCTGPLSTLDPAGRAAEIVAELFWWLLGGALVVYVVVIGLAVWAVRIRPESHNPRLAGILIIGGGAVVPTLILTGYLVVGLATIPTLTEPAPEGSLQISVSGEQWWWRVRYQTPDGGAVELANEIRLPVGEPVQFLLESPDVIHSFWIPSIGGKIDMVPGRVNFLTLEPTRTGVFRGACAEYCGTSHAKMSFFAVVTEREEFDRWLANQARDAEEPPDPLAVRGRDQLLANGCGSCHTVRGTPANGAVGPDLTHVASRLSIAAGILPTDADAFHRWIAHTEDVKPGVLMPEFGMLPQEDLRAMSAYLESLR